MRGERCHLNYQPKDDKIYLVDHGAKPMTAVDMTEESLFVLCAWVLRAVPKGRRPNIFERVAKRLGFRVTQAAQTRTITTGQGTLVITVEHLV